MARPKKLEKEGAFDPDLAKLPDGARLARMDGSRRGGDFRAREPLPREALARLVGETCKLDDLIADIIDELCGRHYEIVFVAGGWQFRSRSAFRQRDPRGEFGRASRRRRAGAPELLAATAIAYLLPATRGEISRLAGKEISRDVIGALKRHGLIDGALRAGTRRALRLCHDGEILGGVWAWFPARTARHRAA